MLHENRHPIEFETEKTYGNARIINLKCFTPNSAMPYIDRIIVAIEGDPFDHGDSGMMVYCVDAYNTKFLLGIYEGLLYEEKVTNDKMSYHLVTLMHKFAWFTRFGVNFPAQQPVVFYLQKKDTTDAEVASIAVSKLEIEEVGEELVVDTSTGLPADTKDEKEAEVASIAVQNLEIKDVGEELVINTFTILPADTKDEEEVETFTE
jgi:hypothetical protein